MLAVAMLVAVPRPGAAPPATGGSTQSADQGQALARIAAYVEGYYARAQRVMADEAVSIQPLRSDMTPDGFARRLAYEIRIEWDPTAEDGRGAATAVRQLVRVGNRPSRPKDEPGCTDPRPVSPEPLAFLLASRHGSFAFRPAGVARVDGRATVKLDYEPAGRPEAPVITWRDDCVSVDLPGRARGRVWADPGSGAVVRLDEQLVGSVAIPVPRAKQRVGGAPTMTIDRAETSIHYGTVTFDDPDETLMLPSRIESVTVVRDSGSPRFRTTQVFTNYRRFLTTSRVVE